MTPVVQVDVACKVTTCFSACLYVFGHLAQWIARWMHIRCARVRFPSRIAQPLPHPICASRKKGVHEVLRKTPITTGQCRYHDAYRFSGNQRCVSLSAKENPNLADYIPFCPFISHRLSAGTFKRDFLRVEVYTFDHVNTCS